MDSWIGILGANVNIICSAILSISPWGLSSLTEYHLFSDSKALCIERNELSIWLAFFFVVLRSAWDVVEHRHEDNPSCEFFWCYTQSWQELLDTCGKAAMWWILGRYSTRIPLAHHQYCPKLCTPVNFWTTSTCLPMRSLIVGSRSSYQDTIQNLKRRRLVRWRLIKLFRHQ